MSRYMLAALQGALFLKTLVGARVLNTGAWDSNVPGDKNDWQVDSELIAFRNQTGKNFIFCALPKNGCGVWKHIWGNASRNHTADVPPSRDPEPFGLDLIQNSEIFSMLGPGSTAYKAVIVRDPAVRMLSSYLDLCVFNHEWNRCFSRRPISFEQVVSKYEARAPGAQHDIHFRNQTSFCGLQFKDFVSWDFVGKYEGFVSVSQHILRRVNMWHSYGQNGWDKDGTGSSGAEEKPMDKGPTGGHRAEDRMCEHYTPALLQRVYKLYKPDYQQFNYSIDPWLVACLDTWATKRQQF